MLARAYVYARDVVASLATRARPLVSPDAETLLRFYDEHGWVLLRGALSSEDVARVRAGLRACEQEKIEGDLAAFEPLGWIARHPRIVQCAKTILGEKVEWFGDASWSYSGKPTPGAIGFHKDCPDKDDASAPDWAVKGRYPILRIGVYLGDYVRHSGGLALRDRSHETPSCDAGAPIAVPSLPGDLVIWSLRTTHSGFVSRMSHPSALVVPLGIQKRLLFKNEEFRPRAPFLPAEHDRPAAFLTYGAPGPVLDRYLDYLMTRKFALRRWRATTYSARDFDQLRSAGLTLRDLSARARGVDLDSAHEFHVPLPR